VSSIDIVIGTKAWGPVTTGVDVDLNALQIKQAQGSNDNDGTWFSSIIISPCKGKRLCVIHSLMKEKDEDQHSLGFRLESIEVGLNPLTCAKKEKETNEGRSGFRGGLAFGIPNLEELSGGFMEQRAKSKV
jgi:hypothetical protein